MIKLVSNLRQVGDFLWVLRFHPPIKLTIVECGIKHNQPNKQTKSILLKRHQINCLQRTPNQLSTKDTKSIVYKGHVINCPQKTPNHLSTKNSKSIVYKGYKINCLKGISNQLFKKDTKSFVYKGS